MSKVFRITPRRVKRVNNTVLTPEMSLIVTLNSHSSTPFYNGAKEVQEAYMRNAARRVILHSKNLIDRQCLCGDAAQVLCTFAM